jgi:hypothetical protein
MKKVTVLALAVMVPLLSPAQIVLTDNFDYPDGALGSPWVIHSGSVPLNVVSGRAFINQADATGGGADLNRLFSTTFDPTTDNTTSLYAAFTVNFSALPFAGSTNAFGSYFAHFKSSTANEFYARVGATTEGAAAGAFRLSIANETWNSAATMEHPTDLFLGTTYQVVMRLSLGTDQATLWINPLNESSTSVTATDAISFPAGGLINAFALRQGTSGTPSDAAPGALYLDNLLVGTTFASVIPEPSSFALLALGLGAWILRRRR